MSASEAQPPHLLSAAAELEQLLSEVHPGHTFVVEIRGDVDGHHHAAEDGHKEGESRRGT